MSQVDLPYFDQVLDRLSKGDKNYEKAWGRHVHWGYWRKPAEADGSVEDFERAADAFCDIHHSIAGIHDGLSVLDVGCGFGGNIEILNEKYSDISLYGLNIDPRQIDRANALVAPRCKEGNSISFRVGNAVDLPYEDSQFDVVLALECIFHFPSREVFLSEAMRVLKPGGRLVFSDFAANRFALPFLSIAEKLTRKVTTKTLGFLLPFESLNGYKSQCEDLGYRYLGALDITDNVLPSVPVYRNILAYDDAFPKQMFETQNRVADSMKAKIVDFVVLSFEK